MRTSQIHGSSAPPVVENESFSRSRFSLSRFYYLVSLSFHTLGGGELAIARFLVQPCVGSSKRGVQATIGVGTRGNGEQGGEGEEEEISL